MIEQYRLFECDIGMSLVITLTSKYSSGYSHHSFWNDSIEFYDEHDNLEVKINYPIELISWLDDKSVFQYETIDKDEITILFILREKLLGKLVSQTKL